MAVRDDRMYPRTRFALDGLNTAGFLRDAKNGFVSFPIDAYLNHDDNPNAQDEHGDTVAHILIKRARIEPDARVELDKLLKSGKVDFNVKNNQGQTPADLAAALAKDEAPMESRPYQRKDGQRYNQTAHETLQQVAANVQAAETLRAPKGRVPGQSLPVTPNDLPAIQQSAPPEQEQSKYDDKATRHFLAAARRGQIKTKDDVASWVEKGANINAKDDTGNGAVHMAVVKIATDKRQEGLQLIEALAATPGFDPNLLGSGGNTAASDLVYQANHGYRDVRKTVSEKASAEEKTKFAYDKIADRQDQHDMSLKAIEALAKAPKFNPNAENRDGSFALQKATKDHLNITPSHRAHTNDTLTALLNQPGIDVDKRQMVDDDQGGKKILGYEPSPLTSLASAAEQDYQHFGELAKLAKERDAAHKTELAKQQAETEKLARKQAKAKAEAEALAKAKAEAEKKTPPAPSGGMASVPDLAAPQKTAPQPGAAQQARETNQQSGTKRKNNNRQHIAPVLAGLLTLGALIGSLGPLGALLAGLVVAGITVLATQYFTSTGMFAAKTGETPAATPGTQQPAAANAPGQSQEQAPPQNDPASLQSSAAQYHDPKHRVDVGGNMPPNKQQPAAQQQPSR